MARTRLIRPEFFTDEIMGSLPIATRYIYTGLWTLTDDAGYFDWSPNQIGIAILPHETPARRRRLIDAALATLRDTDRVRVLECGRHAVIPRMPDHRIKGGEQLFTIKQRHERRCYIELRRTTENYVPESVSDSESVSVSNRARDDEKNGGESEFRRRVPRPLAIVGGNRRDDG